jgi:hypothetical protein
VGNLKETDPLGRPRLQWDDNIKMHVREVGWHGVNGICLSQDSDQWRVVA